METSLQAHMRKLRAEDRRKEDERVKRVEQERAEAASKRAAQQVRQRSNYGSTTSYTPATDYMPVYVPPQPDPSPASDYSGGGGSFDGGGASGDY